MRKSQQQQQLQHQDRPGLEYVCGCAGARQQGGNVIRATIFDVDVDMAMAMALAPNSQLPAAR